MKGLKNYKVFTQLKEHFCERSAYKISTNTVKGKNAVWVASRIIENVMQNCCVRHRNYTYTGRVYSS